MQSSLQKLHVYHSSFFNDFILNLESRSSQVYVVDKSEKNSTSVSLLNNISQKYTVVSFDAEVVTLQEVFKMSSEMRDSESECTVCSEEYKDSGDHIPRLLPCSHTICESCVSKMIAEDALECPECKKTHPATEGGRSFPQNRYIFQIMKNRKNMCKAHGQQMSFFCPAYACQKEICAQCFADDHRKHSPVSLDKKQNFDALFSKVDEYTEALQGRLDNLSAALKTIEKNNEDNINEINGRKEHHMKLLATKYDGIEREISTQGAFWKRNLEGEMETLMMNIHDLEDLRRNTDLRTTEPDAIKTRIRKAAEINEKTSDRRVTDPRLIRRYEYEPASEADVQDAIQMMCGKLNTREATLDVSSPSAEGAYKIWDFKKDNGAPTHSRDSRPISCEGMTCLTASG